MDVDPADGPLVAETVRERTARLLAALRRLSTDELVAPSALAGWSRLTIACHLRYGAAASARMTADALAGLETSFYRRGRAAERPATLLPSTGESADDVVRTLVSTSALLAEVWSGLGAGQWATVVRPPEGVDDVLGTLNLATLALLRLTEIEVHGSDLGIGLNDWSGVLVTRSLPVRLSWLDARRRLHPDADLGLEGRWLLRATDGPSYLVTAGDDSATSRPEETATIEGTMADLLAFLLGRPPIAGLTYGGDVTLARRFKEAFPGP